MRQLIVIAAGAAVLALAQPAAAANKVVDAAKVYPYLEGYLKLPAAERSRWRPTYAYQLDGKPLTAPIWIVDGQQRIPAPYRPDGRVGLLPTLNQLQNGKVEIGIDAGQKVSINLDVEPVMRPAAEMDARELAASIAQAAPGIKKAAGVLAIAAPKLHAMRFKGVGSGEAILADGRHVPLPIDRGEAIYDPSKIENAKTIRLPKAPVRLSID